MLERISRVIQSAIKYRVLFLFASQKRYLFLCRSFRYNPKSGCVTTESVISNKYKWKWMYAEGLFNPNEGVSFNSNGKKELNEFDFDEEDDDEEFENNNDLENYYWDIICNISKICELYNETNSICYRELLDWVNRHSIDREEVNNVISEMILDERAYIDDHLYLDKNVLNDELYHGMDYDINPFGGYSYDVNVGGQGRYPSYYFDNGEIASFSQESYIIDKLETELDY